MSDIVYVDDNNFDQEVLNANQPVLVDFSAVWCGPCQRLLPIVEKFATDNKERIKVVKVDVDEAINTTSKYSIRGVPALLLFMNGKKIDSKAGLQSLNTIDSWVREKTGV